MTPDSEQLPFAIGDTLAEKYRVDRVIGAGGMGVVVEATHLDLDRKVAVKLIRPELAEDELLVERLMFEARAAAKIKSEHVGAVLDVGRLSSGVPFIVMEYLEGLDLAMLLERDGPLPIIEAVDLLLGACEALAHAHRQHIVHRDLKPENLFVITTPTGERSLKVLDFGISKQVGDPGRRALTNPETAVGSPQYMAPEQMQGGEVDMRADVWAIGAILYEMLCAERAFDGDTIPIVCAQVLGGEPIPLTRRAPNVPDSLGRVVTRCLSKDREVRYASVARVAEALAPFGSDRAALSMSRIVGILDGVSMPGPVVSAYGRETELLNDGVALSGRSPGTTKGVSVDSVVVKDPRSASLRPVWIAVGSAIAGIIGMWTFVSHQLEKERLQPEAETAASAQLAASSVATGTAAVVPSEDRVVAAELSASAESAPAVHPADASVEAPAEEAPQASPQARPSPVQRPKPARPKPAESGTPKTDAWDPDSFGGRH